jgi:hypothetical protein
MRFRIMIFMVGIITYCMVLFFIFKPAFHIYLFMSPKAAVIQSKEVHG